MQQKTEIQKTENKVTTNQFNEFTNLNKVVEFAETLCKSGLMAIKDPNTVAQIIIAAGEMQLPVTFLIDNSFALNGKLAYHTKVQRALAIRAGITHEVIHDARPHYNYSVDKDTVINQSDFDSGYFIELPKNIVAAYVKGTLSDELKAIIKGKIPCFRHSTPYDYETVIKFTRFVKTPMGVKEVNDYGKFTYIDAENAGLLKKDNWKYLREMLFNRAYAAGIRRIAPDNGGNLYTVDEISEGNLTENEVTFSQVSKTVDQDIDDLDYIVAEEQD